MTRADQVVEVTVVQRRGITDSTDDAEMFRLPKCSNIPWT